MQRDPVLCVGCSLHASEHMGWQCCPSTACQPQYGSAIGISMTVIGVADVVLFS